MSVLYVRNAAGKFEAIKTIRGEKGDPGAIDGLVLYDDAPAAPGEAAPGESELPARGDHVHPMPTAEQVGALPGTYEPPVKSVNGQKGDVVITGSGLVGVSRILFGTVSADVPAASTQNAQVTFEGVDSAPAVVLVTPVTTAPHLRMASAVDVSAEGFTACFYNALSAAATMYAYWTAIWA